VWFFEIKNFFRSDHRIEQGPTLAEFWGAPQDAEENALRIPRKSRLLTVEKRAAAVETATTTAS
jgi:anaerobic magnesium-protoporphyrin IX monomethyl ester cyclase